MPLKLFSLTYPDGRPGVGLLLMRSALGLTAAAQGAVCLSSRDDLSVWTVVTCLLALATGPLLLIGFLTPLACVIVGLSTAVAFSMLTAEARVVLLDGLFFFFVTSTATAAMLLGPGAYSLDARLFGRREIIIPQPPRPSKP